MARGRMLNRKISVDSVVSRLINEHSPAHGLVFTWMIAHLDRDGRMAGDPGAVKGLVVPMITGIDETVVSETLEAASDLGLLEIYEDDRKQRFVSFPRFESNQIGLRYSREPESDFQHPDVCRKLSGKDPEVIRKSSGSLPAEGKGREGNKREGNKREGKGKEPGRAQRALLPTPAGDGVSDSVTASVVADIWAWYKRHHPKAGKKMGTKEQRLCRARLKDFSPDDIKQAIDGYHRSPYHCGQNETGTKYQSIELILRDNGHTQKGIEMASDPSLGGGMTVSTRQSVSSANEWLRARQERREKEGNHEPG